MASHASLREYRPIDGFAAMCLEREQRDDAPQRFYILS